MDGFRKTLAVICAVLFTITAMIAVFMFTFDRRAFTAHTYQNAFDHDDFYNKLPGLMADVLTATDADQSQFPAVMQSLGRDSWEIFFRNLLPGETLKTMGDEALQSTFAYLNMESDSAQFTLTPLKTSLASEAGLQAVYSLLASLPDCTIIQIAEMTLNHLSGGEIKLCNPPAELYPLMTPIIELQLEITAAAIPDQLNIITAPPQKDPRQSLKIARLIMRLSPLLPLGFLLALTLFAVRSFKGLLHWWGIPFFATGLLATVLSLLSMFAFGTILQGMIVNRLPEYLPVILLDYGTDLAAAILKALLTPILFIGIFLTMIGVGMVLAGNFVKERKAR